MVTPLNPVSSYCLLRNGPSFPLNICPFSSIDLELTSRNKMVQKESTEGGIHNE